MKAKIRALTHRVSQADMGAAIGRINQILRGGTNYFRRAVCKHTSTTSSTSPNGE
ncbi:group II intron maturase-specific domain-containing protein [Tamaricihabitans halophyticus]|uniref:group II intron maturase-specific domain-containing protein n=1 Tax=Tamaricihabitans halophyticus TaxID=1262583 RepID=UPI001A9D0C5C|nr:group II intron maturase-specific domain-containing protein [Tamaricihabitans halophyticus]